MGMFRNAKGTVEDVRGAAQSVAHAAELQTVALICVAVLSLVTAVAVLTLTGGQED